MATKKSEYIMPAVVLMLICAIISGLLAVVYNLTYVDNTGVLTEKLLAGCKDIFGEGEYQMIVDIDEDEKKIPLTFDGVTSVILDEKGNCLFEIYARGYEKDGIHFLIGFDNAGAVKGISIVDISETPGLGTKVNNSSYLSNFTDMTDKDAPLSIDNITGASRSSMGLKNAVSKAIETFKTNKEVIFSE